MRDQKHRRHRSGSVRGGRLTEETPTTAIADIKMGQVEIAGKAVALDEPLESPCTRTPCVYYSFTVCSRRRRVAALVDGVGMLLCIVPMVGIIGWPVRGVAWLLGLGIRKARAAPGELGEAVFYDPEALPIGETEARFLAEREGFLIQDCVCTVWAVEDDTGLCSVDVHAEPDVVLSDRACVTAGSLRDAPADVAESLRERYKELAEAQGSHERLRYVETVLKTGARVNVVGCARTRQRKTDKAPFRITKGEGPFIVSDGGEQ